MALHSGSGGFNPILSSVEKDSEEIDDPSETSITVPEADSNTLTVELEIRDPSPLREDTDSGS